MPQQSGPRNGSEEEKAALPQRLVRPTFAIPPHVMGRNIENPVDDLVAHGRRLQKPRLGVKVPYRNLTSQIVTQDEIAQEIFERSMKKHPVHDTPEGGDIFFALKLTQRLASRLTPSTTNESVAAVPAITPGRSTQFHQPQPSIVATQSSEPYILPDYPGIPDHMRDDQDLLAILEGDVDTDWPEQIKPLTEVSTCVEHYSHRASVIKLDPILEKELALKQLMEFQKNSRRKKEKPKPSPNSNKPGRKPRSLPKTVLHETEDVIKKPGRRAESVNTRKSSNNVPSKLETKDKVTVLQVRTRKRKSEEVSIVSPKRSKLGKKKPDSPSLPPDLGKGKLDSSGLSLNDSQNETDTQVDVKKNERKYVRKQRIINKTPSAQSAPEAAPNSPVASSGGMSVNLRPKRIEVVDITEDEKGKANSSSSTRSKDVNLITCHGKRESRDKTENNSPRISMQNMKPAVTSSLHLSPIEDSPSVPVVELDEPELHFSTPPIRTYSPRKRAVKTTETGNSSQISIKKEPESPLRPGVLSTKQSQESATSNSRSLSVPLRKAKSDMVSTKVKNSLPVLKSEPSVSNSNVNTSTKKAGSGKKWSREIARLLQDEGAINFLYEIEQGDRRRSTTSDATLKGKKSAIRNHMLTVRNKKKRDLMLRTKLVKNAVLRLSESSSQAPITLRMKRRSIAPTVGANKASLLKLKRLSLTRNKSVDSNDSLRSPPTLTPLDSPSPSQSFIYPPRLPLAAEASRIIRRHSSSSNFSSRSTSPNNVRVNVDVHQSSNTTESKVDNRSERTPLLAPAANSTNVGQGSTVRKKGVPIFVRKVESMHTYTPKGKRKKIPLVTPFKPVVALTPVQVSTEHIVRDVKPVLRVQPQAIQKAINDKKKVVAPNKMTSAEKAKLKVEMSKNFQKAVQPKVKASKLAKKKVAESSTLKGKKKEESVKGVKMKKNDEVPDLNSCLAAAASAFAAEAKASKKVAGSGGASQGPSPCPSRGSKSPTPSRPPLVKKEPRLTAPLSPNAATYSNLIKTLENENQKQRKKDGERSSVRQNAGTFQYREICLRRYDNLVQVILSPQSTKMKSALNLQVLRELRDALQMLRKDDQCRAVLLTSTGSSFCQGVDLYGLLHLNTERRKAAAQELAQALKDFMKCLALFNKPIVAGVHGPTIGVGVTMLPYFDMVFASDKATFYTPYARLGQVPEGAAILTLPHMFGNAVTSELLFGCRKLTASEALRFGLVTRILWPDRFLEELIPIARNLANQSSQSMEATKALLRHSLRTKLDAALESESHLLVQHWCSNECQNSVRRFLEEEDILLQRQRLDA